MSAANLPRPLNPGEFYCHKCKKFFLLAEHDEHKKEHETKAR